MLEPARSIWWALIGGAIIGVGFGFINIVFIVTTQAAVGWKQRGAATASNQFMRQLGAPIGTAAFGAVFNLGLYTRVPNAGDVVTRMMNPLTRSATLTARRGALCGRDCRLTARHLHHAGAPRRHRAGALNGATARPRPRRTTGLASSAIKPPGPHLSSERSRGTAKIVAMEAAAVRMAASEAERPPRSHTWLTGHEGHVCCAKQLCPLDIVCQAKSMTLRDARQLSR